MLSLNRSGFTADAVALALQAPWGSQNVSFRYDLLDKKLAFKRTLANVRTEGNSVSLNALDEIKRKARFSIVEDGAIDWLSDRIKPHVLIEVPSFVTAPGGWAVFPCGVFLPSTPELGEDDAGTPIRDVDANDQTIILKNYKVTGKYLVPLGTKMSDAIKQGLELAGITWYNIAPSVKQMPFDREWDAGTSMLAIVNDLLEALNYFSIWFDEEGLAVGSPYVLPAEAPSEYAYADDGRSVIARPLRKRVDLFEVPNQWVFYSSEASQAVSLRSVYTNDNPGSPLSTVNRGMTIVDYRQVEAPDQATLDALVRRAANDASEVTEQVTWQSWLMPMHSHMDNYTLTYKGMGLEAAKMREVSWSMDLRVDGFMQHEARRAITV